MYRSVLFKFKKNYYKLNDLSNKVVYYLLGGSQAFNAYAKTDSEVTNSNKTDTEGANSTKTFVNNSEQLTICINAKKVRLMTGN